jgi:ABC-2 type transport system ATP-binding protein
VIEIKSATVYYKNSLGIDSIKLKVGAGEVMGVLGQNGAGKTTLLKAVANLVPLTFGEVLIEGKAVKGQIYNMISFVTEEGSYFPNLTPMEHQEFFKFNFENFDEVRFNKLLDFFNIDIEQKLGSMSKGQRSKFEVALGFSKGAKYILMDEPFLGKDVFTRRDFLKLMITTLREDETIIIATHLIDEIENMLTRAIILKDGNIKKDISMDDLREEGKGLYDVMAEVFNYNQNKVFDIMEKEE